MNEMAFAAYLLDTLLQEVFHSKHKMAQELDVTLRTLQLNMKAGKNAKEPIGQLYGRYITASNTESTSRISTIALLRLKKGACFERLSFVREQYATRKASIE